MAYYIELENRRKPTFMERFGASCIMRFMRLGDNSAHMSGLDMLKGISGKPFEA